MSDNGKDQQQEQERPAEGQIQVAVLANIIHNPETNELGLQLAPAITNRHKFCRGLIQLALTAMEQEYEEAQGPLAKIARINPGGILRA